MRRILVRWSVGIASIAAAAAIAALSATASAQGDSGKLYRALLNSRPASIPGFSPPVVTAMKPNESDTSRGMIGAVGIVFTGSNARAEIRYAVFGQSDQAAGYAQSSSERIGGPGVNRIFFPYLPDADCAEMSERQLCTLLNDNVYVLAISTGIVTANTHERQTVRGMSVGNLAQFATNHLRRVVASIEGSAGQMAPAAPAAPAQHQTDPCAILTSTDAAAVMGSSVANPTRGPSSCYYQSQSAPGEGVSLEINEGGREKFDFDRGRILGARPLNGIGNGAFEFASAAGFVQVYAIVGARYFTVMVFNHRDPNAGRSAANLARTIASRVAR